PEPDGFIPYITVDEVRYNDAEPWPLPPDGLGPALSRRDPFAFANDPANWRTQYNWADWEQNPSAITLTTASTASPPPHHLLLITLLFISFFTLRRLFSHDKKYSRPN
ncbi:MAG TPA: hypothetical protein VLL52_18415, partial [Anaerolineae bacterium]|nr:hypothetical protein [Anaerolineae bacterium]